MTTPLRPMNLSQLLDRSFFLYRKHFATFVGIAVLPMLSVLAFQLVGVFTSPIPRRAITTWEWMLATMLVSVAAGAVAHGATVVAVSKVHLGQTTSAIGSLASIRGRFLSLAFISVVATTAVLLGFLFFILPGIILGLAWSLTIPVAVVEGTRLTDSLARSWELTRGSRAKVFVVYLLVLALFYMAYLLVQGPLFYAIRLSARHRVGGIPLWNQISLPIGGFIVRCLVGPLMTIAFSLLYYDQRVRKEAFDLQHMMATLDIAQGDVPTPAPV